MTFAELMDQVPSTSRHLPVEINVDCGQFPSSEEGAEDWLMSAWLESVKVTANAVQLDVRYE